MSNQLLKFITCGSVDDGKSTLIGHMLYDAKLLFADQEQALEMDSRVGSREGAIDYSLLLDGLVAEREQGITIDVAYRYFTTDNRSFIVADTPGHEEYTRNMAVGASFADLAVILVDASQGVLVQTRRHTRICALMGIRHFVFAVNKMDLIDYNQSKFKKIAKDIRVLTAEYEYDSCEIIPVCATEGDNITEKSQRMPWHEGMALLPYLEQIDVKVNPAETGFTMPVQRVCRPNHTFRGFQGQVESGAVRVGDCVTVLPSGEQANVCSLHMGSKQVEEIVAGQPATIQLDAEIDCSRGCVIVNGTKPAVNSMFSATLLWMDDTKLLPGKNYLLKIGTQKVPATVMNIKYRVDVNTGREEHADAVFKNEIARCEISVASKIVFDTFEKNNALGSLILIDRVTNMTAGCGVVEHALNRGDNLTWHNMDITREFRESALGQKACTIWLTGLSGSGKSTVANELEKCLVAAGKHTMLLDGDNIRLGLNKDLGFGEAGRIENIRRIAEVAKLLNDAGIIVLTSFISPFARDRQSAREIIGEAFFEVYVSTPIEECERRDVKGLYAKARAGEIANFTGISSPFEVPTAAEVEINTAELSVEECADLLMEALEGRI